MPKKNNGSINCAKYIDGAPRNFCTKATESAQVVHLCHKHNRTRNCSISSCDQHRVLESI